MKRKIFLSLIAAVVLFTALSCSNDNTGSEKDSGGNEVYSENNLFSDLSDESYDGYNFRILTRKGQIKDQYVEEDSEDIVQSGVYRRNKLVEERYGITISAYESSDGNYETDALNSILAGDDAYDLIFPHSRAAMAYALQGAVYNINDISTIDLDKPYWSQDLRDTFEVNGKIYFLDGDISTHALSNAMCLTFNKRIFDELGFEYPYEMVKDGEWTFDEFAYLAKKGGADLNGDGVMNPADDRYGFFDSDWFGPIQMIYTGGQKIFSKNDDGFLELSVYNNKTVEIFSEYFSLMDNKNCFLRISDVSPYTGNLFKEGRAMMSYSSLGMAAEYRSMDDDFGILPYPKFTEEDEYAAIVNAFSHVGIIPITVSDAERTGAIAEALCAYGSEIVVPAFYETTLKTKSARDDESEEMMDIIKDGIVYDIGYISGGAFSSTGHSLAQSSSRDFASFYATHKKSGESYVEEFNVNYGGNE